jgi:hypothetical protein
MIRWKTDEGIQVRGAHVDFVFGEKFVKEEVDEVCGAESLWRMRIGWRQSLC